jgi:hypothetical protein
VTHSKAAFQAGFVLCVTSLVIGQITMSYWLMPGTEQNSGIVKDIGYTFTGLTAMLGFILWKWSRHVNALCQTKMRYWRSKVLQAMTAMIPVFFGCVYFYIAGKHVEHHARTFAALPPFVYLLTIAGQKNSKDISRATCKT